ncbi:ribosome recycling factor [Ichthyobacterium seriolicida]|uniref:Ribosome-recycling factor n=1 Tax=Ichthyobacterium seriolicida TaxID=242600 RepID=A0A1J1E9Y0_9FLAO|nr:ribosome recycling factor [Ichthyobacterium seriolicida]BAV94328.1 ribosome recycling factor [Ichthyobacterium seriolicida]
MIEEVQLILDSTEEQMMSSISHLDKELLKIRAGKASPAMLNGVEVDYYGTMTPISQVSNINTPDGKTISVQPWEKNMLEHIERAIINSNLGFSPMNNGELIIINIPPLTEERRLNLVKQTKSEGEESKISIRNARKEANNQIKQMQVDGLSEDIAKDYEAKVQILTDKYTEISNDRLEKKREEIMTI